MSTWRPEKVTHRPGPRGAGARPCLVGGVLLLALVACARPGPAETAPAPAQAAPVAGAPAAAPPAQDASVSPPAPPAPVDLDVQLAVRKPLRLTASGLRGALVVTLTNRGPAPVEGVHPDVHGLRFIDAKTGAVHLVEHPCDCGFVLGLAPYPPSRSLRLAPGASTEVLLEEWDCAGGAFEPPPPGRYRVSWRLAAPAVPDGEDSERLGERCRAVLRNDDVWRGAPVSNELELELSSQKTRSRK